MKFRLKYMKKKIEINKEMDFQALPNFHTFFQIIW